jgi:hypothetical protein
MIKSDSIKELAVALSKFQGEVKDAPKTKEVKSIGKGPSYKHADLAGILEIARPILSKYGLSVIQMPGSADNKVTLETLLIHESGEWVCSTMEITIDPPELMSGTDSYGNKYENRRKGVSHPQEVGKYITYIRRYALAAVLGISQIDDEESMINSKDEASFVKNHSLYNKPQYNSKALPPPSITNFQIEELKGLVGGDVGLSNYIRQKYKIQRLEECNEAQYIAIKDELRIMKSKIEEPSLVEDSKFLNSKIA